MQIEILGIKTEERIVEAEDKIEEMIRKNYRKLKVEMEGGEKFVQEIMLKHFEDYKA
jgi:hypothetical protein